MMIRFFLILLTLSQAWAWDFDPLVTSKANKAKQQAEEAFISKEYATAIHKYKYLLDTLKIKDEKAQLNLAHAYMRNADYVNASNSYSESTKAIDASIRSIAHQQLGIIKSEKGSKEEAMASFKNALRANPNNKEARYNYELLLKAKDKEMPKPQDQKDRKDQEKKNEEKEKKKQDEQQKKQQQKNDQQDKKDPEKDPNKKGDKSEGEGDKKENKKEDEKGNPDLKEKDKKDQNGDKGKQDKEGEKKGADNKPKPGAEGEKKPDGGEKGDQKQTKSKEDKNSDQKGEADKPSEKGDKKDKRQSEAIAVNKEQLQKMNMSEQQAKSLLNAMRQQEVQYIQQLKKQPSKHGNANDKDW